MILPSIPQLRGTSTLGSAVEHLIGVFTETREDWRANISLGTDATAVIGFVGTLSEPGNCSPGWFAGESTLILGAEGRPKEVLATPTQVEWQIAVPADVRQRCDAAFLVIASKRVFGGLHSRICGTSVSILVNGHTKDDFKLEAIPPQHSDYFYRPTLPEGMPHIPPFDRCGTVYAWPLEKSDLNTMSLKQAVGIHIAPEASWDVDYVAVVLSIRKKRMRKAVSKAFELFCAAILGALACKLLR